MSEDPANGAAADPTFPLLHPRPEHGWLNDPNGVCKFDGRWHLFFQWNPESTRHERIHWGHISSADLLTWRVEPVALVPRPGQPDSAGCWTGCVVDDAGTPTSVYSAVSDHSGRADVLLARSDRRLLQWEQTEHPVLPMPDDPRFTDVRDPYLFEHAGHRWAVIGAGHRDGDPAVLVYRVDELTDWIPAGTLFDHSDPVAAELSAANVWECPNLFRLGDRWVLIISLWTAGAGSHPEVSCLVGDLELSDDLQLRFRPRSAGRLDDGPAFYAPQAMTDGDRVLLWGWVCEQRDQDQLAAAGWAGCLTLPRELALAGDRVSSRPAAELSAAIGNEIAADRPITASAFVARFDRPGSLSLDGVDVIALDRSGEIWVDGSVVEVYPAGAAPYTTRAYPGAGSAWTVDGPARVYAMTISATASSAL
ncbi:glycoside hydrolase family 32 protein [Microlunatus elymi]|uniref:glycoside hydrolase family 32 protein n=1 Tax=Microlunatus elymi TaxID=2596828 RepID=UPI00143E0CE3|nr:glycoside hydrolase family 32 protein [Microlunatus elymi]